MPKYVQIGSDVVEFPDNMSDAQIAQVIQRQQAERQRLLAMPYSEVVEGTEGIPSQEPTQMGPAGRRAVGLIKGAFVDPLEAVAQIVGGEAGRRGVAEREASYQAMRQRLGETGIEGARLVGNILSPIANIPAVGAAQRIAQATTLGGRVAGGAAAGVAGTLLQPVSEAPADIADFAAAKVEQLGVGAVLGGLIQGGLEGVRGGASFLKDLSKPLTSNGQKQLIKDYVDKLSGPDKQKFIDVLNKSEEFVPGSRPTAAEALAEIPESVNIAAAQARLSGTPEAAPMFARRAEEQAGARLAAVQGVGGTAQELEAAVAARAADASRNYGEAFGITLRGDPELARIASNPYFRDALPDAVKLAEARGITAKTDLTQFLQFIKLSLDKQLSKTGDTALSGTEKREVALVKDELMGWLSPKNPAYQKAREEFSAASKPINQMEIGQFLETKLNSALDTEKAGSFALAVRDAASTIKRASGEARFQKLEEVLTPKQNAAISGVLADLQRASKAKELAARARALNIDANEAELPQLLNRTAAITNAVLRALKRNATEDMNREMAKLFANPKELAAFMSSVPKSRAKDLAEAIYSKLNPQNKAILDNLVEIQAPIRALTAPEEQ
jgi:hypothetical protein